MTARPLVGVHGTDPKAKVEYVTLPSVFTSPIRPDLVADVHSRMARNKRQAYAVSKHAGHQSSAESWGTGRAVARIPRVSGGGTHRAGQGAFGNMCRGGRMFAPTKTWRRWHRKININEKRYALCSAIAATAVPSLVLARGHRVERVAEIPLVIDNSAIANVDKTSRATALLKTLAALDDVQKAKDSHHLRVGKGKYRNRRYVQRKGPLVIYNEKGPFYKALRNVSGVELVSVNHLNLLQLAPGGHLGRFVIWTKDAFQQLDTIYGSHKRTASKSGFILPRTLVANPDLGRIINSDEIQSALRDKIPNQRIHKHKKNGLTNLGFRIKLNPYAKTALRQQLLNKERKQKKGNKVNPAIVKKNKLLKKRLAKSHSKFRTVLFSKK